MKVNIQGIEDDVVEYDAELDNSFIDHEVKKYYESPIRTHVVLDKFGRDYRVDIGIETSANYTCDRCLVEFNNHFEAQQRQLFHVGDKEKVISDDIVVLPEGATEINLAPYLKEMILLNHPIKMICNEGCKGLCAKCGANLNIEKCRCSDDTIDPRWDELRKLIK